MNWYIKVLTEYANFAGRARRKEYWMFFLVNVVISLAITIIARALSSTIVAMIGNLYSLAVLLPGLGVAIRRMHDTNRSGWWILVPLYNLYLLCIEGDPGDNQYGPNPKLLAAPRAMGASA